MPAIRVRVTGWVQGVGFRAFVEDLALELGLSGEVWNTRDRAVEAVASHRSVETLTEFVSRIQSEGPGRVDKVEVLPSAEVVLPGFSVGYTR